MAAGRRGGSTFITLIGMGEITNTRVLQDILRAQGLSFTPPASPSPPGGPGLATLSFIDPEGTTWTQFIFAHEDAALLRFYSHISAPVLPPPDRVLALVNHINYSYLFESSLDFAISPPNVRFKSAFRGVGVGLPAHEAAIAIQAHISRASYLHLLLKHAYRLPGLPPEKALDSLHQTVMTKLGMTAPPPFS